MGREEGKEREDASMARKGENYSHQHVYLSVQTNKRGKRDVSYLADVLQG